MTGDSQTARSVRQVEKLLRDFYLTPDLIEASDLDGRPDEERNPRLLSRALTAQAVRIVTGFSHTDAAIRVMDGVGDQGIDAIAVVTAPNPHVYIVQGKWSKNGTANSDRKAVLEMADGMRLIDDETFAEFNQKGRQLAEEAHRALDAGAVPVTQVYALMRWDEVTPGFTNAVTRVQRGDLRLAPRIILAEEIWDSLRNDTTPPPIELELELFPWYEMGEPKKSYQGVVDAEQIAQWNKHGSGLFDLNIRNPLGRTSINNELIGTLAREPEKFWYFNNGITILCETAETHSTDRGVPQKRPLRLTLKKASVVNGAQTVRAVAQAVTANPDASAAEVNVRVVVTGQDAAFAKRTTQSTNRQNRIEPQDFIALELVQAQIAEEMRIDLDLEYSVRRGALEPQGETGCSVLEAASALACLQPDSQFAARAAASLDNLWDREPHGMYHVLFRPQPSAFRLWNAVQVLREVRRRLHELLPTYESRGAALIDNGEFLLTHLVFRRLDLDGIEEPDSNQEWRKQATEQVPALVDELLRAVPSAIDSIYGDRSQVSSACTDVDRCRTIVEHVLSDTGEQSRDALITDKYRRQKKKRNTRRPNAVTVLMDRSVLPDGAPLSLIAGTSTEEDALKDWLTENPEHGRATWAPDRKKPILWAVDGEKYSPSGLVTKIWELAGWEGRPVSVQGTARWKTPTGESIADLAWRALREADEPEDRLFPSTD